MTIPHKISSMSPELTRDVLRRESRPAADDGWRSGSASGLLLVRRRQQQSKFAAAYAHSAADHDARLAAVLARTATDLTVFSPTATCLFYAYQGAWEQRPLHTPSNAGPDAPQGIYERLEERLWPTVQKQWAVFGPANLVNLSVVPLYARPPFMNVISIGWNTFLASAQSRGGLSPDEALSRDMQLAITAAEVME